LAATYAVARILREGVTLDAALRDALARAGLLGPSVRSLSYGAVRGYFRHEAILGRLLSRRCGRWIFLVRALLSVALFELEDARTPEYAVVDAAVKTAKATDAVRASGLINAVLRRYLRERKVLDAEIARNPVPPGMPRPSGLPIACAPTGRCAGPSCWQPATPRRPCGCG
jgi:16S rRNA (cytosine967-C5)-methyltransferase